MIRFTGAVVAAAMVFAGLTGCAKDEAADNAKKGDALFKKKQYAEAAQAFEASVAARPDEKIYEKLAVAHSQAGNGDAAEAAMLKAIELKADPAAKVEGYRNLAGVFLQKGPLDKAEVYFLKALELNPKDDASLQWLGEINSVRGGARAQTEAAKPEFLEKAVGYYDQAIALVPQQPNPYLNKRIALLKYAQYAQQQAEAARLEAEVEKDAARKAELQAAAQQHAKKFEELKANLDETTKKVSELQKAAAAAPKQ